jgi:RimJ/RimL family protein N-acetyltransferase
VLETARLNLRRWRSDDLDAFAAINADREVTRFLGGKAMSPAESAASSSGSCLYWNEHGFGLWPAELKDVPVEWSADALIDAMAVTP